VCNNHTNNNASQTAAGNVVTGSKQSNFWPKKWVFGMEMKVVTIVCKKHKKPERL
jgi:hypothetical protein